jgi:polysaccharide biosynthesis/export protein
MKRRLCLLIALPFLIPWVAQPAEETAPSNLVEVLRTAVAALPGEAPRDSAKGTNTIHRLAEGDVVQLLVYQEDDLNLPRAPIAKDGTISHPLLGLIPVGGKTLDQAKQAIFELLQKDYLVDPRVSLTILEYAKIRFTVVGQANRLGTYEFPSNEPLTLVQAVALAGGPTRSGSQKIKVQRVVDGSKKELHLNLDKKEDKVFLVQDSDVIEVGEKIF